MTGAADKKLPLNEVMMAMDVVDTLRHRDRIIERELSQGDRDAQLYARLREIYTSQGIDVPEHVLREGVAALKEDRFLYTPPPAGFNVTMATLYVHRLTLAKWTGALALVLIVAFAGWRVLIVAPRQQAAETLRVDLSEGLPLAFDSTLASIGQEASDTAAIEQANRLVNDGKAAAARGDADTARSKLAELKALRDQLLLSYEIRIVSRPGTPSGVERIPDVNRATRNLYVVVEAIGVDGKRLSLPVQNEEDGKTEVVPLWAVRVPKATFDAVKRDKQDDGIIQNATIGVKERGTLQPNWVMKVDNGAITTWK
ncbi:DUF6384 family protein [Breoghania sp. L-A4]|uniref:DUF6384 family protein n=1 Tax=Breoghania sp. L-A4 TaxID=2304600 RepID=UPI000E360CCE|nr:DUF6384 family protein [Breoghania sp. L-A4]AXS41195.1 hypothetical protein D1F64_15660 [Breoghania sp. L-A4]